MDSSFPGHLVSSALSFRGYNTTNLGRSHELLVHPVYGPTVERHLREASEMCTAACGRGVDLVERVRSRQESSLDTFGGDIGLIMSMELAQLELLQLFHGVDYRQATLSVGYSLGEITALVAGDMYQLPDVLVPLVKLADECAELANDTTMGVVFSRGPALSIEAVEKLCLEINLDGQGVIAMSSILSPNTVLVLGQGTTVDRFRERMKDTLGERVNLRKQGDRWPPLHTPLMWQRAIPNRASVLMHTMQRGFTTPKPNVLSLVTGKMSYTSVNSRELIADWLDKPQRLWDVVYELLAQGIRMLIHIGPEPNLIPATFKRLSDNVTHQIESSRLGTLGMQAMRTVTRRPWLNRIVSNRVALLRAPFVHHLILEDWLLDTPPK